MKDIDFLPPDYRAHLYRKWVSRKNRPLFAILAISFAALFLTTRERVKSAEASLRDTRIGITALDDVIRTTAKLRTQQAQLQNDAALIRALTDAAPPDAVLAAITNLLGNTIALYELRIDEKTVAQEADAPASQRKKRGRSRKEPALQPLPTRHTKIVRVTGIALTDMELGVFLGRLSSSPLFEHVTLVYSRESNLDDVSAREFQLTCDIQQGENET